MTDHDPPDRWDLVDPSLFNSPSVVGGSASGTLTTQVPTSGNWTSGSLCGGFINSFYTFDFDVRYRIDWEITDVTVSADSGGGTDTFRHLFDPPPANADRDVDLPDPQVGDTGSYTWEPVDVNSNTYIRRFAGETNDITIDWSATYEIDRAAATVDITSYR